MKTALITQNYFGEPIYKKLKALGHQVVCVAQPRPKKMRPSLLSLYPCPIPYNPLPEGQRLDRLAAADGLPYEMPERVGSKAFIADLQARGVELVIAACCAEIFKDRFLRAFPRAINIHPGRLPGEAGPLPPFWAVREGRNCFDVTLHRLVREVDRGAVLARASFTLAGRFHTGQVYLAAAEQAADCLARAIDRIDSSETEPMAEGGYRPIPMPTDVELRADMNLAEMDAVCRAALPFATAGFFQHGKRLGILNWELLPGSTDEGPFIDSKRVALKAADGYFKLQAVYTKGAFALDESGIRELLQHEAV